MNIRWHGWGGQGLNAAISMLTEIAVASGKQGKAIPDNCPESEDIPQCAFSRIGEFSKSDFHPIVSPDLIVVFDAEIFDRVNAMEGIPGCGRLFVNTSLTPLQVKEIYYIKDAEVLTLNAKQIMTEEAGEENILLPMLAGICRIIQLTEIGCFKNCIGTHIYKGTDAATLRRYRRVAERSFEEIIGLWRR